MRQVLPDVWETATESPFPGLTTHAYLLLHPKGNVLFYNTGNIAEIDGLADLGGVAWQFISHRDEVGDGISAIHQRYGARLVAHAAELAAYSKVREPDILVCSRETFLGNIEAIPTPGHTPGSICYLVALGQGRRYLFTGDTIFRNAEGGWSAGYIKGYSEPEPLLQSLELLAELEPDVVFSSAFSGLAGFEELTPALWRQYVEVAAAELRQGKGIDPGS